jgi:hypothetical protein
MRRLVLPFVLLSLLCACQQPSAPGPEKAVSAAQPAAKADPEPPAEPAYDGPPKTILVELFSSQGCDSCPAADAFVGEFPKAGWTRDKVIPLTFHVTYWDDLGWKDPFGSQLFDQRQIGYAQNLPKARADDETTIRGPYTPQMVVDGRVQFSGTLKEVARAEIESARRAPTLINLELDVDLANAKPGAKLAVAVTSTSATEATFDTGRSKIGLFAALAQQTVQTEVPRGENAGKKITEHWVVRDFQGPKLFRSSREVNETAFELTVPKDVDPKAAEVVVFAQDLASLQVIAVAAKG